MDQEALYARLRAKRTPLRVIIRTVGENRHDKNCWVWGERTLLREEGGEYVLRPEECVRLPYGVTI